ncbi:MAG: carbamoyl phosphate synthase small subunit [Clostridia bacterium]
MKKAYLILQDGQVFEGTRFGAGGMVSAELVFETGMIGYLETLTDPGYQGLMVAATFPLAGNYGVIPADFSSSAPHLSAFIVREVCDVPSNFRCEGTLDSYLKEEGVIGLCDIDTRALTRILRESGAMNAAIVDQLPGDMAAFTQSLARLAPSGDVIKATCAAPYCYRPTSVPLVPQTKEVVLWDFGYVRSIAEALSARGCRVQVVPADTALSEILAMNPDGIVLSGGPGDPANCASIIEQLRGLDAARIPTLAIDLGHQLLALAHGAKSLKMKHGHRGANQPVRRLSDGRLFTTCQNHGFVVDGASLPKGVCASYENVNDHTVEGLVYEGLPLYSVQFTPKAQGGACETAFLFDEWMNRMSASDVGSMEE